MNRYRLVTGDAGTGLQHIIKFEARNNREALRRFDGSKRGNWGQLWKDDELLAQCGDEIDVRPTGAGWRLPAA